MHTRYAKASDFPRPSIAPPQLPGPSVDVVSCGGPSAVGPHDVGAAAWAIKVDRCSPIVLDGVMTDTLDPATANATGELPARRPNDNPYLAGNLAPVERGGHRVRPAGDGRDPRRARRPLAAQRTEPASRRRPRRRTTGSSAPAWCTACASRGGKRGVVPQPLGARRGRSRRRMFGANTNVGGFAGTTWAMVEGGIPPIELDYELDSLGPNRFDGTLDGPFTAHPKYDPSTGELHSMNYHWPDLIDHVNYTVVGGDGRVTKNLEIPVDRHADDARHVAHPERTRSSTTCR